MTNPTVPYLAGVEMVGCNLVRVSKPANLMPMAMPTLDSDETLLFDFGGSVLTTEVAGTFADADIDFIRNFINTFESIASGDQTGTIPFTSDITGTIDVMINGLDFTLNQPGNNLSYSIKLTQGVYI